MAYQVADRAYFAIDKVDCAYRARFRDSFKGKYPIEPKKIVTMYKERWAIESFFRWIKQNLNVPVLFGMTPNVVFSQLFAAIVCIQILQNTYVLLKFLHARISLTSDVKSLLFAGFTGLFLWYGLDIQWQTYLEEILTSARFIYQKSDT